MRTVLAKAKSVLRNLRAGVQEGMPQSSSTATPGKTDRPLNKCWQQINRLAGNAGNSDLPTDYCQALDLEVLNCRTRIGRQPDGESWRSILIVEICGTIRAPDDGHTAGLRVSLQDVTDNPNDPLPVPHRPKQGPLNPSAPFTYQADMGRLCHATMVLEDWTTVAQISPEWFVLPRQGQRKLKYGVAIVSQETGDQLAWATCVGAHENLEPGYLDIEDNIQRAKSLAVGLAFSVGAANGQLLDPETNVISAWVRTHFGSAEASAAAKMELDRAMQKTVTFFRRGGTLNIPQVCSEIVEIAPLIGRLEMIDLCLRVAAAKGQVNTKELTLLKDISDWLEIDRNRLRAMVEKILPVEMHQSHDAEVILGVTTEMSKEEARHQLNREYAKWSSRVISSDPAIRRQADQMLRLIADARTEYVGLKLSR